MTEQRLTTMQEAAGQLLDTLMRGDQVTLDIIAQDEATEGLLRLITAIHDAAQARRVAIHIQLRGERSLRLQLAEP